MIREIVATVLFWHGGWFTRWLAQGKWPGKRTRAYLWIVRWTRTLNKGGKVGLIEKLSEKGLKLQKKIDRLQMELAEVKRQLLPELVSEAAFQNRKNLLLPFKHGVVELRHRTSYQITDPEALKEALGEEFYGMVDIDIRYKPMDVLRKKVQEEEIPGIMRKGEFTVRFIPKE